MKKATIPITDIYPGFLWTPTFWRTKNDLTIFEVSISRFFFYKIENPSKLHSKLQKYTLHYCLDFILRPSKEGGVRTYRNFWTPTFQILVKCQAHSNI